MIRRITRLGLELSHLRQHKFNYIFQIVQIHFVDVVRVLSIEWTSDFLLHCPMFNDNRRILLSNSNNISCKILKSPDSFLTQTLLFGTTSFDTETDTLILNATIDYILSTDRFEQPLFYKKNFVFRMQHFTPFRVSLVLFYLSLSFVLTYFRSIFSQVP